MDENSKPNAGQQPEKTPATQTNNTTDNISWKPKLSPLEGIKICNESLINIPPEKRTSRPFY